MSYDKFPGIVKSQHQGNWYRHINHFIFGHLGEAESREAWLNLKPGDVFLDVGSAIGSWTMPAAASGAKVYAFDPGTDADMLRRMVAINDFEDRVEVVPKYVCYVAGETRSRSEIPWHSVPAERKLGPAESITIDQFVSERKLDRVDIIKIDVDGAEGSVLCGAEDTLRRFRPRIIVEIHDFLGVSSNEVTKWISGLGYSCEVVSKEAGYYHHAHCVPLPG